MLRSKFSDVPENNSFAAAFMPLKLRREFQEDYKEVGESKVGLALQDVNKIMCSLKSAIKGMLTERQTQWTGVT